MELNLNRFIGSVSNHLVCSICLSVFTDPVQDPDDHIFCKKCIEPWVKKHFTCPIDRKKIKDSDLKPASRTIKNLLNELEITCDYKENGCTKTIKLELLKLHLDNCEFNPNKMISCPNGCEIEIQISKLKDHSCIKELKSECKRLQNQIDKMNIDWKNSLETLRQQCKDEFLKIRNEGLLKPNIGNKEQQLTNINSNNITPQNIDIFNSLSTKEYQKQNQLINASETIKTNKSEPVIDEDTISSNCLMVPMFVAHQNISIKNNQKYSFEELRYNFFKSNKN